MGKALQLCHSSAHVGHLLWKMQQNMVQIPCIHNNLTWAHEGVIKVGNSNDRNDRVSRPDLQLFFNKTIRLTLCDSQHILHIQQRFCVVMQVILIWAS